MRGDHRLGALLLKELEGRHHLFTLNRTCRGSSDGKQLAARKVKVKYIS